jgi:hypothetical protein
MTRTGPDVFMICTANDSFSARAFGNGPLSSRIHPDSPLRTNAAVVPPPVVDDLHGLLRGREHLFAREVYVHVVQDQADVGEDRPVLR